jgi:hypothetical protein
LRIKSRRRKVAAFLFAHFASDQAGAPWIAQYNWEYPKQRGKRAMDKDKTHKEPEFDLFEAVHELINHNESVYNENENSISAYMKKRWEAAFGHVMELNDTDFPPSVGEIADMGLDHIEDPQRFMDDLRFVIRGLSKGGQITDGEFSA